MAKASLQQNLDKVAPILEKYRQQPIQHFINGKFVAGNSGETFANICPVDGKDMGEVAAGNAADVDAAAGAAQDAFADWAAMNGNARRNILRRVADGIESRAEEIALVESMDSGQALRFMSKAAIRGAENFRFFADRAPMACDGQALPTETHLNYTTRMPLGPVAVITPWNTPFMLSTWKIAPALAAGCTVVHKPAEWSPLSAVLLAEICKEAGLPPGVLNTVHGDGINCGRPLTMHPNIKAVAFVGESVTGSHIMAQGAETLKRVHFELGGKNPVLVFADADMDRALDAVVFMIYSLNGERCTSSSRLLVEKSIHDQFTARVTERVRKLRVGHPLDYETVVGPLIHADHKGKVCEYFSLAREQGATVSIGGEEVAGPGHYVKPTLFSNATNDIRVAREEIFGPVLTAIPFADEQEALHIANDTQYGLAAYLWTGDTGRAHRIARSLEAGMVWVNSENNRHLPSPFGGMKMSGIGRDGGDYSFDFYMETKNVCVALDKHTVPVLGG